MTKQHKAMMRQQVEAAQGMVRWGGNDKARCKNQRKEPKGGEKKVKVKKNKEKKESKEKGIFFFMIQIQNLNNTKTKNIKEHNTHNTHNLCEHK